MVKNTQTIVGKLPTSCLSVFDHFVGLARKGLKLLQTRKVKKVLEAVKFFLKKPFYENFWKPKVT